VLSGDSVWLCISALLYILYNLIVLWVDRKGWLDQWYVFNTIIDSNQKVKKPIVILGTYGMLLSDMVEMDNYIVNKRISTLYIPSFLYIKKRCYI